MIIFAHMHIGRFYWDYVKHFFSSTTRHGTHSPFVYQLVDEVIYAKREAGEPQGKVERLTERLIRRFKPDRIYRLGTALPAEQLDFVVFPADHDPNTHAYFLQELFPKLHQGSLLVVTDIYRGKNQKQFWRTVKALPGVTVTIDLFHLGIVFFHAGQAREDFRIRF